MTTLSDGRHWYKTDLNNYTSSFLQDIILDSEKTTAEEFYNYLMDWEEEVWHQLGCPDNAFRIKKAIMTMFEQFKSEIKKTDNIQR